MNCFFFLFPMGAERFCVWYKFYTFLRIDKFQRKHSASFTMEIVSHNSHTRLSTCITYNSTSESWDLESGHGRSSQQDLIYVSRPNANHINFTWIDVFYI
jgi:hypothetical protein